MFVISELFIIFIILISEVTCKRVPGKNLRERRDIARNLPFAGVEVLRDAAKLEDRIEKLKGNPHLQKFDPQFHVSLFIYSFDFLSKNIVQRLAAKNSILS